MSTAWIRKNDLKLILFDISNLVQAENLAVMQTGRPYSLSLRFGHLQDSPLPSLSIASTSSVTKNLIETLFNYICFLPPRLVPSS